MKRNNKLALALVALSLTMMSASPAFARHHGNNGHNWQQNGRALTTEQQAAAQKIDNDYAAQSGTLRQQLMSKRYEYNALLTATAPDASKINATAKEMETLRQSLDALNVKRDIAMAQAGFTHDAGMGYGGCQGNHDRGNSRGMNHW